MHYGTAHAATCFKGTDNGKTRHMAITLQLLAWVATNNPALPETILSIEHKKQ